MAGDLFSKGAAPGQGTSGLPANARPPPSTLAAQLVENISASTKSSKSDENTELKGFFTIIQRYKDDPKLLKTSHERVAHNHMLIYVYSRVVLDGIKFDDPFHDRTHTRAEILKAINFLRFTIKETPTVLEYRVSGGEFLCRGPEPLWMWLLPQLLRLLGHSLISELDETIEGLIQYILLVVAQTGVLWQLTSDITLYLRTALTGIIAHLQKVVLVPAKQDMSVDLELPPIFTLARLLGTKRPTNTQRTSYKVDRLSQALRQTTSLANILMYPLISEEPVFETIASFSETSLWLFDTLLDIRACQRRWTTFSSESPFRVAEMALKIINSLSRRGNAVFALQEKAIALLILLCSEIVSTPDGLLSIQMDTSDAKRTFCIVLLTITEASIQDSSIARLAVSKLGTEFFLQSLSIVEQTDIWRAIQTLQQVTAIPRPSLLDRNTRPDQFEDVLIRERATALGLEYESATSSGEERAKRLKVTRSDVDDYSTLISRVEDVLKMPPLVNNDDAIVEQAYMEGFQKADSASQCLALDVWSRAFCAMDQKMNNSREAGCARCDSSFTSSCVIPCTTAPDNSSNIRLFARVVRSAPVSETRRHRVAAMVAARRPILHCNDPTILDLESSELGKWCLQSLNSSIRELRIAAGRTLTGFVLERGPPSSTSSPQRPIHEVVSRNRKNAIAVLKSISDQNAPNKVETCILAWGQLGRVFAEDELNLVLIKLLEYLGSSNAIVSAFAFNELQNLSESRDITIRRLFEPFWPNLAYMATKDMVHRPQMSRAIAELLQISVNELLLLIQTYALPWLVLDKQKDVIQKIAEARQEKEIWQPLMDGPNMAATVALLLIQDTQDIEAFTLSRLNEVSSHFQESSLVVFFQSEPVLISIELLKAAGEADESRRPLIRKALHHMATRILAANKETKQKTGNTIGRFLHRHLLGLMARLTDVINDTLFPSPPVQEQRRCIRAMEQMITVCKDFARIARPQISACLLSALTQEPLRETSLSCWAAMLAYFEEEDVEALLETTFFIVKRYGAQFDASTTATARKMLLYLLDRYQAVLGRYVAKLPSLHDISAFGDIETTLQSLRPNLLLEEQLGLFSERISHENSGVVLQALMELVPYLELNQPAIHESLVSQQPDATVSSLMRALLDCACKYSGVQADISQLCTLAVGLLGCLDANKIENTREQPSIVILNNFAKSEEAVDFALFVLEYVLVPAFLSATDVKLQGFLSFAMQELLSKCEISSSCAMHNAGMLGGSDIYRKWIAMPESVREVVSPFLTSKYMVAPMEPVKVEYPIFHPGKLYGNWLKSFVVDLLRKGQTNVADLVFQPLARVIRVKDLSTAEFLLPYLVLHILLGTRSGQKEKDNVLGELIGILQHQPAEDGPYLEKEDMKRYCHVIFSVLDYAQRWLQAKRTTTRLSDRDKESISRIQEVFETIPAELISQRATDCNDYARALFHLEQHAQKMEQRKREPGERTRLLERLQDIYANIDEPDGLDGISSHLHVLDINQQILSHRKAGRWTAVQSWYEMQLSEKPDNIDVKIDLLHCLKQAGQHDVLLNHVEGMHADISNDSKIMPFAVEAAWVTGRWERLANFTKRFRGDVLQDFNVSLATIFESLHQSRPPSEVTATLRDMREKISLSMTTSATTSFQAAHDLLLRCHVLTDLEMIIKAKPGNEEGQKATMTLLDRRLEMIGAYSNDKQYILGVRRAAMELTRPTFSDFDISGLWLSSARLARKSNSLHQSFTAVLHASQLGDDAATIENAKLLWIDGHHRKAIQMLQGAISRNKFMTQTGTSTNAGTSKLNPHQKLLTARAQLLLAKWLDTAGQTHASALREKYQQPPKTYSTWEKGHYYLGRHYKKILEAEKPLKVDDQTDNYVTGEIARLVIENYVRSLISGTKYLYQTLPRILTLWLDLGAQVDKAPDGKMSLSRELHRRRIEQLGLLHAFLDKYIYRLPAYIFYTALPQIVARIAHPNNTVFNRLTHIIVKVVEAHPRQALWSLIGIMTTKQVSERKARGGQILNALRSVSKKVDGSSYDLKYLLRMGERLADQLLLACQNGEFQGNKTVHASLTRDLRFSHKCTPCPLVVPVESSLTATLPAVSEYVKRHKAFSRDVVTIDCFLDDVLVLSSLAKPRRLTARGSDGKSYMLLIKPKDDLRTDQRLMEFNGIINRSLKRDAESSRRQLYIRTYAVTPLNEECGIIEWVPGIRTMRDILLGLYASRKIYPDYPTLRDLMESASTSESNIRIFTDDVVGRFPPILHLWFTQQFPNPSSWFAARLRYTRSCAVMSMVGTILGLGDRHGENVNIEEGNGGVFHVDFNCLFDKGLTFAKPERVPFRLTHNMVAAMGIYGYEGPFRKSSELTLSILRQQEETLMTILEAFIYDPTLDLQKEKRSHKKSDAGVKLQPQSVVDSIKRKVKGLPPNESIPLGVEGQVEELIKQAVNPRNLTAMYIGWCPFL